MCMRAGKRLDHWHMLEAHHKDHAVACIQPITAFKAFFRAATSALPHVGIVNHLPLKHQPIS